MPTQRRCGCEHPEVADPVHAWRQQQAGQAKHEDLGAQTHVRATAPRRALELHTNRAVRLQRQTLQGHRSARHVPYQPLPAAVIVSGDAHPCMELESCTPGYPPAACPPRARGSARHSRLDLLRKTVQLGGIDWRSLWVAAPTVVEFLERP